MEKKTFAIISIGLLILVIGIVLGYFVTTSLFLDRSNKEKKWNWKIIKSLEGSDAYPLEIVATDYFYISTTELRINWTYIPKLKEASSLIRMDFYVAGDSTPVEMVLMSKNNGTTFIHNVKPASYYVDINLFNLEQWKITVEAWIAQ